VLMKENHSYDNYFGMLGRGDGFTLGADGLPVNSNPDSAGQPVRAHHLSLPINPSVHVSQTWDASHQEWNGGAMDGFVTTTNSDVPMGYLDGTDLPWYYGFARTYGIGDRYFCSVLARTFPNRRFLQAATASGLVNDAVPNPFARPPQLIWDLLDAHKIGWANYFVELPEVALWPRSLLRYHSHLHDIGDFYDDCKEGRLPPVTVITTEIVAASEGEYEDDQIGEAFTASLFDAASAGPQWSSMLFVVVWDEGGGFYDSGYIQPLDFFGDGPRIPLIIVSPFTKGGHVNHTYADHVSILKFIERNWGLDPLTRRSRDNLPNPRADEDNPYVPKNSPAIASPC